MPSNKNQINILAKPTKYHLLSFSFGFTLQDACFCKCLKNCSVEEIQNKMSIITFQYYFAN